MLAYGYSEYNDKELDQSFIIFHRYHRGENNERFGAVEKINIKAFLRDLIAHRRQAIKLRGLIKKMELGEVKLIAREVNH